ncbi:endonuclease/exonuclease/phosphatase family protein [Agarivorans sp. 1_MG-2023]|uniref:endonuclease/exonuclease/phosphatase family protein n=1 Tax=Agarivorans sp. 1_MG-2023 TaxID=3062634 RepID=UPI0026E42A8E|nr:endonuclease/exonuclease/phosphatase family protein [Agarivorans sp. 1_MG-2023]MDO6763803.1 endonuclease/exonuclease/phosphatase family protein [Agarivorans sp. 1_MG-2023]
MNKLLKASSVIISLFSLLLAALILILEYLPDTTWGISLSYLMLFSPRWWAILVLLSPIVFLSIMTKWQYLSWALCAVIFVQFQDVQLALPNQSAGEFTVLSLNNGNGASSEQIRTLVAKLQPDVVFMQESKPERVGQIFDDSWFSHCDHLCTVSRTPIEHQGSLSRETFGGWGKFAVFYQTQIGDTTLQLANIHMDTPRPTINALIHRNVAAEEFANLHFARNMQASLLASWAKQQANFIAAGDFNMTTYENIYQRHLADLNNAIDIAGSGVNYTKYTSWHGARIDHLLASEHFEVTRAMVLESMGGDHRPITVSLNLR